MRILFILLLGSLVGCSSSSKRRKLSPEEIEKYKVNGIIHDVKVCPTEYNDQTRSPKIVGSCQILNCEEVKKKVECWMEPEDLQR